MSASRYKNLPSADQCDAQKNEQIVLKSLAWVLKATVCQLDSRPAMGTRAAIQSPLGEPPNLPRTEVLAIRSRPLPSVLIRCRKFRSPSDAVKISSRSPPKDTLPPRVTRRGGELRSRGASHVFCTSSPDIFKDVFGQDFSTSLIGKTVQVEGEVTRAFCNSLGGIRVTLARQLHLVGSGAGMLR
jgi:hypothetical protein